MSDQVFWWGHVTDSDMITDLVSFLSQSRRTAVLTVVEGSLRKSIYFDRGSVLAASSSLEEDRFGNIMFRRGLIDRAQLDEALTRVRPGHKIGNVLLSMRLITANDLWRVIKIQIEEILFSVLLMDSGQFTLAKYDVALVPTRTKIETQHVLLEGLRRKDELQHLLEALPEPHRVLGRVVGAAGSGALEGGERTIYALVDGQRSIERLGADAGLGPFVTTRALHRLIEAGLLEVVTQAPGGHGDDAAVGALVHGYNEAYRRLQDALQRAKAGGVGQATLAEFFADADPVLAALFKGVRPLPDGRLPYEPIIANLKACEGTDHTTVLRRGLDEYLRFLLFFAREHMPFELVECLAAEVTDFVRGV